jgi:hypothetical protein
LSYVRQQKNLTVCGAVLLKCIKPAGIVDFRKDTRMSLINLFSPRFRSAVAALMVVNLFGFGMLSSVAQAGMVSTSEVQQAEQLSYDRQEIIQLLEQDEVRNNLIALGVDPVNAGERVNLMTDAELAQLSAQIDELPAGGDILGILLIIFLVFVVTDVIGATDIFPFINSVNN